MTRFRIVACGLLLLLGTSAVIASTYAWNKLKRPPISLAEALTLVEKTLGKEAATRYCLNASLNGNQNGNGQEGAWNFIYAANDGSRNRVWVDMQGKVSVDLWNGPVDPEEKKGPHRDLNDVKRQLEALFQQYKIDAQLVLENDVLRADYRTRDFLVYEEKSPGEFGEQPVTMRGPKADGVWLEIRLTNQIDRRDYFCDDDPHYWSWQRGTFYTTVPTRYLSVDMRSGRTFNAAFVYQVRELFGNSTR